MSGTGQNGNGDSSETVHDEEATPNAQSPERRKKAKLRPIRDPLVKRSEQPLYPVENGFRRNIRRQLHAAVEREDAEEINKAIDVFERNRLEDREDLSEAREKLEYIHLRKALNDAILRRHPKILEKTIAEVKKSQFVGRLESSLRKAENLRQKLSSSDKHDHRIQELNQRTISELRRYVNPPANIKDTMTATFLLLGEREDYIDDWDYILILLGRTGKTSVKVRIANFDTSKLPLDRAQKAEKCLRRIDEETVKQASSGTAAFYVWCRETIGKVSSGGEESRE